MAEYHNLERAAQQLQQRCCIPAALEAGAGCAPGRSTRGAARHQSLTTLLGWSVPLLVVYGATCAGPQWASLPGWRGASGVPHCEVLASADRAHGFHASLSTAYEYLQHHATNPFVPGLAAVAERLAPRGGQCIVCSLSVCHVVSGVFLCSSRQSSVFSMLKVTPLRFDEVHEPDVARHVSREGQRLEKWGRDLEELAKREQLDRSMILARQMQQLGQRLQREGGEQGQVTERIATLSQYLQRLQQELRERALMSSDMGAMAAHDVLHVWQKRQAGIAGYPPRCSSNDVPCHATRRAMAEQSVLRAESPDWPESHSWRTCCKTCALGTWTRPGNCSAMSCNSNRLQKRWNTSIRARRALEYSSRSIQRGGQGDTSTSRSRPQPRLVWARPDGYGRRGYVLGVYAWYGGFSVTWIRGWDLALRRRRASTTIRRCRSQSSRRRMSRSKAVRAPCG